MSASLDLYRVLIPAHSAVDDATVEAWLAIAARRHTAALWGSVYPEAMVFWAAHTIDRSPSPGSGAGGGGAVGALTSQRDGDLQRTYSSPSSSSSAAYSAADSALAATAYGQAYLDLRNSRVAAAPTSILAWPWL